MKDQSSFAHVEYSHELNRHTLLGPQVALPLILKTTSPISILDVGCGEGTWLRAALDNGITDIFGVDGVEIEDRALLIPNNRFKVHDLRTTWNLGRQFDLTLCLEVAEHLEEQYASSLVGSLTSHSNTVVFSAACPGQNGQHHINLQWPPYWQNLFNENGFTCFDEFRWPLWDDHRIEPWYRQNMFLARRVASPLPGTEPRLRSVIHPEMLESILSMSFSQAISTVENGKMPFAWYPKLPFTALAGRLARLFFHREKH